MFEELLPHLKHRGEEYAEDAGKKLCERAEHEAKAMREILETQQKHIAETAAKYARAIPAAPARFPRPRTSCASSKRTSGTGTSG